MDIFDRLDYYEQKQLVYLYWKFHNNPACRKQRINPQLFDKLIFGIISGNYLALPTIKSKIWYIIHISPAIKDTILYSPFQNVVLGRLYNLLHWVIKRYN